MKSSKILPLLLLFISLDFATAFAQVTRDFSFNMVRMIGGRQIKDAPEYGFITGTEKSNERFYFVMIYPKKMSIMPEIDIRYKTDNIAKELLRTVRATLIPYDGVVMIGDYRLVVYEADGRAAIRRTYVQDPPENDKISYKLFVNNGLDDNSFEPDVFQGLVQMTTRHFDRFKVEPVAFRLLSPVPDLIASGYPVVDASDAGCLNGVIAGSTGNQNFDVITITSLKKKLSEMADGGYACKYFNLISKGNIAPDCENRRSLDSLEEAKRAAQKRLVNARLQDRDHLFAISLKAGGSGQYTNVSGTVSPGHGFNAGLDFHLLPDTGMVSLSVRPRYAIYNYDPNYYGFSTANQPGSYTVKKAQRKQIDLQLMLELKFNRRLHGHNYLGLGYATSFTRQKDFQLNMPDGSVTRYNLPTDNDQPNTFMLEVGWETGKIRYAFCASYLHNDPFPRDYSVTVNNNVMKPFEDIAPFYLLLNFDIAFRLWGHWRNGVKG